ncbi:MAG: AAA family ATPase [Myxococcaceae bacterium]|nr:AAA family ATPase [Myxococcaceae bacterium]
MSSGPAFLRDLDVLIRARYPLVYLVSWEEQRLDAILADLAKSHGRTLFEWSVTRGLRQLSGGRSVPPLEDTQDPHKALEAVQKLSGDPSLVVLKDFHPYFESPKVVRALRDLAHYLKSTFTTVIILSPTLTIPVELEKELTVLDVPLPTFGELAQLLKDIVGVIRRNNKATIELSRTDAEALVKAAMGLTLSEAENAFAKAIVTDGKLSAEDIQRVQDEKRQIIRKSGLLEFYPAEERLENVGGLDGLKTWLSRRTAAFGEEARRFGLPEPRGILLLGVQGCGKSLTAKAIAAQWRLPLLRLDVGRIFSGLIGSSEENLRRAIRVAESVAPAVLWIDELEKGLAGAGGTGLQDAGVTQRIFGAMLTWLQEKTAPVFVVATANRIDLLPPELLRKGRFDEIFFVDLPTAHEREDIFAIHLARRGRDPKRFDIPALASASEGFSGSEIEQAIISALHDAFAEKVELDQRHILGALRETFPLSTTMGHEIQRLREWAKDRTRMASTRTAEVQT